MTMRLDSDGADVEESDREVRRKRRGESMCVCVNRSERALGFFTARG